MRETSTFHSKKFIAVLSVQNNTNMVTVYFQSSRWVKAHSCESVTNPVTFFQNMSYRGYIFFRIRFHSKFFEVIGNLWANSKCHLGRMHHVGYGVITQKRVFMESLNKSHFRKSVILWITLFSKNKTTGSLLPMVNFH